MDALAQRLRDLIEYADRGGADRAWLRATSDELVRALLELAALRRDRDPRRVRTQTLAERVRCADAALRRSGEPRRMEVLQQRFSLSRSWLYELLSGNSPDSCVADCRVNDHSEERAMAARKTLSLKDTSTGIGGTPAPISKYGRAPEPAPPDTETPRAGDADSNGTTGGNYRPYSRPNGPAPGEVEESAPTFEGATKP